MKRFLVLTPFCFLLFSVSQVPAQDEEEPEEVRHTHEVVHENGHGDYAEHTHTVTHTHSVSNLETHQARWHDPREDGSARPATDNHSGVALLKDVPYDEVTAVLKSFEHLTNDDETDDDEYDPRHRLVHVHQFDHTDDGGREHHHSYLHGHTDKSREHTHNHVREFDHGSHRVGEEHVSGYNAPGSGASTEGQKEVSWDTYTVTHRDEHFHVVTHHHDREKGVRHHGHHFRHRHSHNPDDFHNHGDGVLGGAGLREEVLRSQKKAGDYVDEGAAFAHDHSRNTAIYSPSFDPGPLTAVFADGPMEHEGAGVDFTLTLIFSTNRYGSPVVRTNPCNALSVTGGIASCRRGDADHKWTITITPDSDGSVQLLLPATTNCSGLGCRLHL